MVIDVQKPLTYVDLIRDADVVIRFVCLSFVLFLYAQEVVLKMNNHQPLTRAYAPQHRGEMHRSWHAHGHSVIYLSGDAEIAYQVRSSNPLIIFLDLFIIFPDNSAKSRDVLILNEIGLDPGIDHCSALQLIKGISGAKENPPTEIVSFTSFCGGLPAPEDSHVPLRYKFSWRPQGVLTAALNGAMYLLYARVCFLLFFFSSSSSMGGRLPRSLGICFY